MPESNSRVSYHILSFLEGEIIRVILRDGMVLEGVVSQVSAEELKLGDATVPLSRIATYFLLKES
jgi:hypothetical protein